MIATSLLVLIGLGLVAATLLAVASRLLHVEEDPRIAKVEAALPGANCGGCGYPGCAAAAAAVVAGKESATVCVAGGAETASKVAEIMGEEVGFQEVQVAETGCAGGPRAENLYRYEGAADCRAQAMLHGGQKRCGVGCLGLGSCVRACPFDAIHMGEDGLPVVDPVACRACGKCAEACPRGVIQVRGLTARLTHLNRESDCLAPCRQRCPGQIDIARYVDAVTRGDYAEAVRTIKERNPLLLVCGRVCPRPCESVCRRGNVDEPVGINMLKRFVADWEMHSGRRLDVERLPDSGRKVAVVGGGPAGLSCAFFLRRLGHSPTIFESMPELGGQLRYGIPEYRLPKKVLDWEIQGILDMGVDVETEVKFGRDFSLQDLYDRGFEAVFLGLGAWQSGTLRCEGEDAPGVYAGIEYLTGVGLHLRQDIGEKVIVVGGGNTAIDAARTALRQGRDVTLMYRRTREEMPANEEEIEAAEEEGVRFVFLAQPTRVVLDESGRAAGLEYLRMELGEPDASGRRKPVPVEGSETTVDADAIIAAIGQKPDLDCLYESDGTCPFETTRWRTLDADEDTLQTANPRVFTAGDMHTGAALVITAVGGGRKAARSIHYFLTRGAIPVPGDLQREMLPQTMFKTIENVEPRERAHMPELCVEDRACSFDEVEGALSEEQARAESERCLRCGLLCYTPQDPACLPGRRDDLQPIQPLR